MSRTPYRDDMLRVEQGTQPEEIREFVARRAKNPEEIAGVRIWNFNNHELNKEALREQADDLRQDEYLIPYQASGVWAFMASLLPQRIRTVEVLTYQQERGRYVPYPNYFYHSDPTDNNGLTSELVHYWREEDEQL